MNNGVSGGLFVRARAALLVGLAMAAAPLAARAGVLDEVWVGGFAHDVSDIGHGKESGSEDVQLEVDSGAPSILRFLGAPRLNAALTLNSAGLTNFGAVGLTWSHRLFDRLSGSLDLGGGLTDGVTSPPPGPAGAYDRSHRLLLGSKALFREALGADWRLSDRWSIGAEFVHLSNGLILAHGYNEGVNDAGLRLGYKLP
jgi:lipid A 3-O-deacylase